MFVKILIRFRTAFECVSEGSAGSRCPVQPRLLKPHHITLPVINQCPLPSSCCFSQSHPPRQKAHSKTTASTFLSSWAHFCTPKKDSVSQQRSEHSPCWGAMVRGGVPSPAPPDSAPLPKLLPPFHTPQLAGPRTRRPLGCPQAGTRSVCHRHPFSSTRRDGLEGVSAQPWNDNQGFKEFMNEKNRNTEDLGSSHLDSVIVAG